MILVLIESERIMRLPIGHNFCYIFHTPLLFGAPAAYVPFGIFGISRRS